MPPAFVYFDLCNVLAFIDRHPVTGGESFRLNVGMLPVVAALERARVPLGLVSNITRDTWHHLLGLHWGILPGRFRELVMSFEVGSVKPEPAFFAAAAARAGVDPARIFYVDDTVGHVSAARTAGWDAEPFTSHLVLADALARRGLNLGL